jgi:antitoxin VapB
MKTIQLIQIGESQVINLPKEFSFSGDRVFIKKMGNAVILIPYDNPWQPLFDSLAQFSDDFMEDRDQPTG